MRFLNAVPGTIVPVLEDKLGNLKGALGLSVSVEISVQLFLLPGWLLSAYLQRRLLGKVLRIDCSLLWLSWLRRIELDARPHALTTVTQGFVQFPQ
jgi:hypothetical protein